MDANFNCKAVKKIDFRKDFAIGLFSSQDQKSSFKVIEPLELKKLIKTRIKGIYNLYKDDI
ncbi:hypothetical protein BJV85_002169 [Clostridium acetobutylicum]|uniref:Uncharacterized protein n=1 Tax=Clostridium acetobutylicum (strain ATCC 824 / DSM 792 / JCM 1419 / IAM 19013 / LMG 5710 / NBRC 13948 / NRRL B-527 / VKM B-1787 / 2291 / W) TaxID=272562 RepID=Q97I28_CLOAB|nr:MULTISPECIES: hypothetical protein [Clostridium]AAK79791.1 Hypothetical protein CA_C1826 [Clostridium acetobutylicum ATCC 824]AEI31982.1 hypothetical protein SMB_G1851 [Clostridium acetobutylicum DSM 1731]ADZ20876.1 Conserved hypothetical protein [Clostridium acetobutylicum EA 2018]AWV79774.1 hypothetical protein DK921_06630 [Clostridium acetobutylicum]MBC2394244.1 hypothetical protein [Clostridium acetobutylicum]